jgi:membrane protein involved in colicin uptake
LHNALGIALKGQGLFNDAKNAYEAALKAESTYLPAEYNLGILKLRHLDDPEGAEDHLRKVVAEGSSGTKRARKLLEEAEMLIKAKAEEARMMAEMQRMEEEAARQAEEEAKRQAEEEAKRQAEEEATEKAAAEGAASGDAQPAADGQPAADAPPAEAAPPPPEAEPEPPKKKPQKKRRRRKPKPKPKPKPKASAPEPDDDFFGD